VWTGPKSCSNLQLVPFIRQLASIIKHKVDLYLDGVLLFQQEIYLSHFQEGKVVISEPLVFVSAFIEKKYMNWFQPGELNKALSLITT